MYGSVSIPSMDLVSLADELGCESVTNRSGVLELGLGKSQMEFQNSVPKSFFGTAPLALCQAEEAVGARI